VTVVEYFHYVQREKASFLQLEDVGLPCYSVVEYEAKEFSFMSELKQILSI